MIPEQSNVTNRIQGFDIISGQLSVIFRRLASRSSPSGFSSPLLLASSDRASDAPGVVLGVVLGAAAGLVFFLTRTPFKAFFASFFAGAALGLAVEGGLTTAAAAPIGGGLFAAFSRAATALRKMSTSSGERPTDTGSLSEVFELLPIHLLPETLLFTLFL